MSCGLLTRNTRTFSWSLPKIALKVVSGMTACSASGPPYVEDWRFLCITPITVNGELLIRIVFPTGSSAAKMSRATSFPRKATRRFSSSSCAFRNRPPGFGKCLRRSPYSGLVR